ncbi:adenine specific DNA methylase Mod [Candidatus Nitrosymbiomonas proteolyticus]|uniref:Adenine specific DNA methylase Mod n=1 Tax=Candidatus Nitrosymbiomonas proteolyticus TaxID=2608984 RepID=A0A809R6J7_9BACT|nr:adenine specific DNA methylase Mod [Candidatus Nitrosymbiomonas proteolyticus]
MTGAKPKPGLALLNKEKPLREPVESGSIRLKGTQIHMNEPNANTEVEKLDLSSLDVAELKRQKLVELFPEVRTEGGKIDFERLKAALGEMVDAGRERYGMNWPGKAECMRTIQAPSMGTLLPMPDESVDWDTTENVIIEGDNLEVLKLLQKSYLGKIKMIYIDPPYNTGNDFIYPDNYSESLQTYLEYTGQLDAEGRRFTTNVESDGRFHSKWLNMMYPRLYLARQLLRPDGVCFISIDDTESVNVKAVCDEIFGAENFVADLTVVNNLKGRNDKRYIARANERLFMYVRSDEFEEAGLEMSEKQIGEYSEQDAVGRYRLLGLRKRGGADTRELRPKMFYPIYVSPLTGEVSLIQDSHFSVEVLPRKSDDSDGCWRWGLETTRNRLDQLYGRKVGGSSKFDVFEKDYLETDGELKRIKPKSVMSGTAYSTDGATKAFRELMGDIEFSNPKPVPFLSDLISYATNPTENAIVLDFFAGSGTTGHAVFESNARDGGNRRFVLVQLPEPVEDTRISSIASVTIERVRRAAKLFASKIEQSLLDDTSAVDLGFRAFRLAPSNFIPWDGTASNDAEQLAKQLKLGIDHTRGDRTPQDLLFEVLLKSWGEPALSLQVGEEAIEGVRVFSIAEGAFLICLEEKVTLEFIRALAARKPDRVVMRESAFAGNDQLKTNAVQTFKSQGVTSFKVV